MNTIDIIGDNYFGKWDHTREACRAVVLEGGRVLLSCEAATGQYMLPGGGIEPGEDPAGCCVREVAEETGYVIQPSECLLELDEFYEDWKYVSLFFTGRVTGRCERQLTRREAEVGMEPRWLPVGEAIQIFSRHADYAATDEMRRGLYLREYTALKAILKSLPAPSRQYGLVFAPLRRRPDLLDAAAAWFHTCWGVPEEAYRERMAAYLSGDTEYGWYLCLSGDAIVGGLGVIDNDFHDRPDLAPNICAVYTDPACRGLGVAGRLLDMAVEDLRNHNISPAYLVTDHVGFYERYGWKYLCAATDTGSGELTRVYIHY